MIRLASAASSCPPGLGPMEPRTTQIRRWCWGTSRCRLLTGRGARRVAGMRHGSGSRLALNSGRRARVRRGAYGLREILGPLLGEPAFEQAGGLADFDHVAVRVAHVAANLRTAIDRRRHELGPP